MASAAVTYVMDRYKRQGHPYRARFFDVPNRIAEARVEVYYDRPDRAKDFEDAAYVVQQALNAGAALVDVKVKAVYEDPDNEAY